MSAFHFQRAPDEFADTPWRDLDRALLRWTLAHDGSPALARLAAWVSFADGEGDTALPLTGAQAGRHGMAVLAPAQIDALRGEPLVGDGMRPTPFVLDAGGRFYLWRNHADEAAVVRLLQQRRALEASAHAVRAPRASPRAPDQTLDKLSPPGEGALPLEAQSLEKPLAKDPVADEPAWDKPARNEPVVDALFSADLLLDELFQHQHSHAVQRQRDAVAGVGGRRLFVLTGGPGTGKTTTVLRMLLMLQQAQHDAALTIQVGAPTGKAAQRLVQSLRQGKKALREALPETWSPWLDRIPDGEALTLHRMLAFDPRRNRFARDASRPIAADIVVVDEASMVDLAMLRALLSAVRPDATLILVGDADQLTSVAAGSVLMDLVAVMERQRAGDLVRLEHSFRAEQPLVAINHAVRAGDAAAVRDAFAAAGDCARWLAVDGVERLRHELGRWSEQLAMLPIRPTLPAPTADAVEPTHSGLAVQALRALAQRQLLCALREDSFGAIALNGWIEQRLKRAWEVPEDRVWYPGRAVLITRNDYAARLYNGDVGLCLADETGALQVWFESVDADGHSAARSFAPGTLPAHEGAFAITIHKSQGSEYDTAAVLLPPDPAHRILSRQLLYTGLSRARKTVQLWADAPAVQAALAQPVLRAGGVADRLAGAHFLPPGEGGA